jgi:hypothetical protein
MTVTKRPPRTVCPSSQSPWAFQVAQQVGHRSPFSSTMGPGPMPSMQSEGREGVLNHQKDQGSKRGRGHSVRQSSLSEDQLKGIWNCIRNDRKMSVDRTHESLKPHRYASSHCELRSLKGAGGFGGGAGACLVTFGFGGGDLGLEIGGGLAGPGGGEVWGIGASGGEGAEGSSVTSGPSGGKGIRKIPPPYGDNGDNGGSTGARAGPGRRQMVPEPSSRTRIRQES